MKVGFFDSGSGAYHVRDNFLLYNPDIETAIYADYKNCPYGDRSADDIIELTTNGVQCLFDQGCDVVILACNTASVHALRHLQNTLPKHQRILGVTYPACEAIRDGDFKRVLVISTDATKKSGIYKHYIHLIAGDDVSVINISIPGLVEAIETNKRQQQYHLIHQQLSNSPTEKIDAIVLGCTHYPIITNVFNEIKKDFFNLQTSSIIDPGLEAGQRFVRWKKKTMTPS